MPSIIDKLGRCKLCGSRMTPAYGDKDGERRNYYACANRGESRAGQEGRCMAPYIRVEDTDEQVAALTLKHLEDLATELAGPAAAERAKASSVEVDLTKLQERRARLIDLAADGMVTRTELRERLAAVDAEVAKFERKRDAEVAASVADTPKSRRSLLRDVKKLRGAWRNADAIRRRAIVGLLAEEAIIHRDHPPDVQWKSASHILTDL